MRNFNKVGQVISEETVDRGITVRLTKVWPWKRKEVSDGMKFLVTAFTPDGFEIYNNCHSQKVLYTYVLQRYQSFFKPIEVFTDMVEAHAFSLQACLEKYLEDVLTEGIYLVMVPASESIGEAFWKGKPWVTLPKVDPRRDCYVANVTSYQGSLQDLVSETRIKFPGRYFLLEVSEGFVKEVGDFR